MLFFLAYLNDQISVFRTTEYGTIAVLVHDPLTDRHEWSGVHRATVVKSISPMYKTMEELVDDWCFNYPNLVKLI